MTPPRYADRRLRKWTGNKIAALDSDGLFAVWLLANEMNFALAAFIELKEWLETMLEERDEFRERMRQGKATRVMATDAIWHDVASTWLTALETAVKEAGELQNKCVELIKGACLTEFANAIHDSPGTYIVDPLRVVPAEEASGHLVTLERVRARVADARITHYNAAHEIALADDGHMTFLSSGQSVDLDEIDSMGHREFERLAAILMYRDGYRVERSGGGAGDLGADVIASHRTRGLVVLQCKHTSRMSAIGSGDMQRLSGTGRPVHRADTVIALTNGTFTQPARNLATGQRIHCFGRHELRRWATWGDHLVDILESTRTWNHATGHPQEA